MPITDGWLAFQAVAPKGVIAKHVATVIYLLITFAVFKSMMRQTEGSSERDG